MRRGTSPGFVKTTSLGIPSKCLSFKSINWPSRIEFTKRKRAPGGPCGDFGTANTTRSNAVKQISPTRGTGGVRRLLGPNGAGKTTTLKLLSGVIYPDQRHAPRDGARALGARNDYRRRFALVMGQKNQLWWDLPAQESFRLHQKIYRIDPAEFRTRDELTELLDGSRHLLGQPVRELSLGERMKMELIAALLHSPKCCFSTSRRLASTLLRSTIFRNFSNTISSTQDHDLARPATT